MRGVCGDSAGGVGADAGKQFCEFDARRSQIDDDSIAGIERFADAIAAFLGDLGTQASKVTLVTLSEFGRRVQENDNYGTDHGYGNVMFVAGAGVRGGYHGRWPGLANSYDSDLTVTTDYRQVLADVVHGEIARRIRDGPAPEGGAPDREAARRARRHDPRRVGRRRRAARRLLGPVAHDP